jgi:hypothetical protein
VVEWHAVKKSHVAVPQHLMKDLLVLIVSDDVHDSVVDAVYVKIYPSVLNYLHLSSRI